MPAGVRRRTAQDHRTVARPDAVAQVQVVEAGTELGENLPAGIRRPGVILFDRPPARLHEPARASLLVVTRWRIGGGDRQRRRQVYQVVPSGAVEFWNASP